MLKIYLCSSDTDNRKYLSQINKIIKKLEKENFEIIWHKEWVNYDIIENDIASCDCFLSIAEEGTFHGSTWKHIEITYAAGLCLSGCSSNTEVINPPIPIFIVPLDNKWETGGVKSVPNKIILSSNIKKALLELKNTLYKLFPDKV
jgi:hypothetical protein